MKILFVTSGSENVGTYFRAYFWAKYLVKQGHQVTIISGSEKPMMALWRGKIKDGIQIVNFFKTPLKFDYIGYVVRSFLTFIYGLFHSFDVVHSFVSWQPPSLAVILASKLRRLLSDKPKILADWDDLWGSGGIGLEHGKFMAKLITYMEGNVPKIADKITVCSRFLKDVARSYNISSAKINIIINGSDTDNIKPLDKIGSRHKFGFSDTQKVLIYIGQFQTGVFPLLINSIEAAYQTDPQMLLVIAGSIPDRFYKLITRPYIKFIGKINHSDLSPLFSAADLLLLPMEKTNQEKARFPIRFGDYIASGTPVLASSEGEVDRIISENKIAYIADITDSKNFSRKIISIINDNARFEIGRKARAYAQKHLSWDIITQDLVKLYLNE